MKGNLLRQLDTGQQFFLIPLLPQPVCFLLTVGPDGHLMTTAMAQQRQRRSKASCTQNHHLCHFANSFLFDSKFLCKTLFYLRGSEGSCDGFLSPILRSVPLSSRLMFSLCL